MLYKKIKYLLRKGVLGMSHESSESSKNDEEMLIAQRVVDLFGGIPKVYSSVTRRTARDLSAICTTNAWDSYYNILEDTYVQLEPLDIFMICSLTDVPPEQTKKHYWDTFQRFVERLEKNTHVSHKTRELCELFKEFSNVLEFDKENNNHNKYVWRFNQQLLKAANRDACKAVEYAECLEAKAAKARAQANSYEKYAEKVAKFCIK